MQQDLPFGSEFSPRQIDLRGLLVLAKENEGNWRAFENAVSIKFFSGVEASAKKANNTKLSMQIERGYKIIDDDIHFTELGELLYSKKDDRDELLKEFAKHILLNLKGMIVLDCAKSLIKSGEGINLQKLSRALSDVGIYVPPTTKCLSTMRAWLEKAGVVINENWDVDEDKLKDVIGVSLEEFDRFEGLTIEQRTYLRTLEDLEISSRKGEYPSNEVRVLASRNYGVIFDEKNFAKKTLYPLQDRGYIAIRRTTDGRGAKPPIVVIQEKMKNENIAAILKQIEEETAVDLKPYLTKPLDEILQEIAFSDRYIKGLALEALAFRLIRMLGLKFIYARRRGIETGGAEVDLIFEALVPTYSKWQIQCKNTANVSLDDIAKEIGVASSTKANVIVFISTGDIGTDARAFAERIMEVTNLNILMITRRDIDEIMVEPAHIGHVLNRETSKIVDIKSRNIEG